jgi:hypothetical protein
VRRALLVGACLFLAACGSGAKGLSKEEYAKRADAVCTRFTHQTAALGGASSLKELAALASKTLPVLDRAIADLRKLDPPQDEQALEHRWLTTLDHLRNDVLRIRDRARANDLAGVGAVVPAATRDDRESNRLAAQLGTRVCRKPS